MSKRRMMFEFNESGDMDQELANLFEVLLLQTRLALKGEQGWGPVISTIEQIDQRKVDLMCD